MQLSLRLFLSRRCRCVKPAQALSELIMALTARWLPLILRVEMRNWFCAFSHSADTSSSRSYSSSCLWNYHSG